MVYNPLVVLHSVRVHAMELKGVPLSTCEWRRNRVSYTHWVDHDHRVMSCVVRWDKTWTPTLDALHVLHGIITGATVPPSQCSGTLAVQWCLRGTITSA